MASDDPSDLLMKFMTGGAPQTLGGTALAGRSRSALKTVESGGNELLDGFSPGGMFEVHKFSMSASKDGKKKLTYPNTPEGRAEKARDEQRAAQAAQAARAQTANVPARTPGSVIMTPVRKDGPPDPPVHPISFTRSVDFTSSLLMANLISRAGFSSGSMIKRKAAGGPASGEVFLRVDFFDVLVTDIDWDDDDQVEEKVDFICRSLTIRYRPQNQDGTLGNVRQCQWPISSQ